MKGMSLVMIAMVLAVAMMMMIYISDVVVFVKLDLIWEV